jgi:hypothetical protein
VYRRLARHRAVLSVTVGGLLAVAAAPASAQSVDVFGTLAPVTGGFNYELNVTYINPSQPLDTLALVTVAVPAVPGAVQNLNPPTGFLMAFDAAFGTLDFGEDTDPLTPQQFLAGTTQGSFRFFSPNDLTGATFTTLGGAQDFSGVIRLGSVSNAPEPASVTLLALGVLGGAGVAVARRRRR